MDAVHEIVYPAIAKAQQLSAERLGVRVPEHATRWDIRRPPQTSYGDNGEDVRRLGRQASSGRRREPQQITVDNVAAAMRSSLSMLQPSPSPPTRRGVGDLPVVRRDKPAAVSPLPPRHDRPSQRTVLVDITQILRGVREQAVALERFLSLEVEPAAQRIFDAAASEHAKACRLLSAPPAGDLRIDPVSSSNGNSNSSTPTTATNTNDDDEGHDDDDDDDDDEEDSRGVTAAAASATTAAAAAAAAAGALSDARRRAVKAQVIKLHPPAEFHLSLPAVGGVGAGGAFGRRPGKAFVARAAGAGAGGSSGNARWSLPGRHYRTGETARKSGTERQDGRGDEGLERNAVVPRGAGTVVVAAAAGNGRAGGGGGAAGAGGKREAGADDTSRESDGEWEVSLPDGQLASDISSKMVGLSSVIRSKAAAAAAVEARKHDDSGRRQQFLRGC